MNKIFLIILCCFSLLTNVLFAQFNSTASGNWSSNATWVSGTIPTVGSTVVINTGHSVTLDLASISLSSITINTGGTLTLSSSGNYALSGTLIVNGTLNMSSANITVASAGTLIKNAGGVINYGTSKVIASGALTSTGFVFYNLDANGSLSLNGNNLMYGTFRMNAGTGFSNTNTFTYQTGSQLLYAQGTSVNCSNEWKDNVSTGAGVPNMVTVSPGTSVTFPNGSQYRYMSGRLTINGNLTLSNSSQGHLEIGGDFQVGASGVFSHNGRKVVFKGSNLQTIQRTGGGEIEFYSISISGSGGIKQQNAPHVTNVRISGGGSSFFDWTGAGNYDTYGQTLTLNASSNGNISLSGGGVKLFKNTIGTGTVIFAGTSTISVSASGGTTVKFGENLILQLESAVNFGSNLSLISGTLLLKDGGSVSSNAPVYDSNSQLIYNTTGTIPRSLEWAPGATSSGTAGYPQGEVKVNTGTLSMNSTTGTLACGKKLTINSGAALNMGNMSSLLKTGGVNVLGTLNLSTNTNGNLEVNSGDFQTGSGSVLVTSGRRVFITGSGSQNIISGAASILLEYLTINKSGGTVFIQSPLSISGNSGDVLQFLAASTIDLGNNKISMTGSAGNISLGTAASTITSSGSGELELGSGTYTVTGTTGTLTFDGNAGFTTNASTAGTINTGSALVRIKSYLQIKHRNYNINGNINYFAGSSLIYNFSGGSRNAGAEWNHNALTGSKPCHVLMTGSSQLNMNAVQTYSTSGNFTLGNGTAIGGMGLVVSGDVDINAGASCNLTGINGLQLSGNLIQNISIGASFTLGSGSISISKTGGTVRLLNPLTCQKVNFITGNTADIDLNGSNNVVFSGSTSGITGEGTAGRFFNSVNPPAGAGYLMAQGNFINNINPGNLGLSFTGSAVSLITVKRYLRPITGFGGNPAGSVMRSYEVTATPATNLNVSYAFLDAELNSIDAVNQQLFLYTSSGQLSGYVINPLIFNQQYNYATRSVNTLTNYNFSTVPLFIASTSQYVTPVISSIQNGNWNDPSTWSGGNIPSNIQANVIVNHTVTLNVSLSAGNGIKDLTINPGKSLTMQSGSTLYVGGDVTNSGTLAMNQGSKMVLQNNVTFANSGTFTASNISCLVCTGNANLQNLGAVSCLETSGTLVCSGPISINDTLKLLPGGSYIGVAPAYSLSSALVYATGGTIIPGIEWSATSGAGYPAYVKIVESTKVVFSSVGNKAIGGKLRINNTAELSFNPVPGTYTDTLLVRGDVEVAGTLSLSSAGGGISLINGSLKILPGGLLDKGKGIVSFRGTAEQILEQINGSDLEIYALVITKSSGKVKLGASNLLINGDNAFPLLSLNNASVFDLNGKSLFLQSAGTASVSAGSGAGTPSIVNTATDLSSVFFPAGSTVFTGISNRKVMAGSNVLFSANVGTSSIDFGNPARLNVSGTFSVNTSSLTVISPPEYNTNSTLQYTASGITVGNEWTSNQTTGSGIPYHVTFSAATSMTSVGYRKLLGNLSINAEDLTINAGDLQIEGDLVAAAGTIISPSAVSIVFTGNVTSSVAITTLRNIKLNKTAGAFIKLLSNLSLSGDLTFISGSLDLNGAKVLNIDGSIFNETALNRVYNSSPGLSGYITHTEMAGLSGTSSSLGNLGIQLENISGSCLTEARRYPSYSLMINAGNLSIHSMFRLKLFGELEATPRISYANFGLNGNVAGNLRWWSSSTGVSNSFFMEPSVDNASQVSRISNSLNNNSEQYFTLGGGPLSMQIFRSVGSGNFESATTWNLNTIPQPGSNYIIMPGHTVAVNSNHTISETCSKLYVYPGAFLTVNSGKNIFVADSVSNNGTFTLQANASLTLTGQTVLHNNSASGFSSGTGTIQTQGPVTLSGIAPVKAGIVSVSSGILDLEQGLEVSDSLKLLVNGALSGSFSPVYRVGSTLVYAGGGLVQRGLEWIAGSDGGNYPSVIPQGYPSNIRLYNQTELNVGGTSPSQILAMAQTLRVAQGSTFHCNYPGTERSAYTFVRNIVLENGNLILSSQAAGRLVLQDGDIYSQDFGNLVFTGTNSEFEMRSGVSQQRMDGKFAPATGKWLFNNSFADITHVASLVQFKPSCNIDFLTTKGLDGYFSIECNGTGAQIACTSGNRNLNLNGGGFTFAQGAAYTIAGPGTITINAAQLNVNAAPVNIGNGLLILTGSTILTISNSATLVGYPIYSDNTTLCYQGSGNFIPGSEWQTGSGPGSPFNVSLIQGANLYMNSGSFYVRGNFLTDNSGNNIVSLHPSTVLYLQGNLLLNSCQFIPNTGKVVFNGSSNQQCLATPSFYHIDINNSGGNVLLLGDISIDGNLNFISGNLDLNGKVLTLGAIGQLQNETSIAAVIDPGFEGKITTTRNFLTNNITSSNNGNIGIEILNSPDPLGVVTLERYVRNIPGVGVNTNIGRVFSVWPPQAYDAQVKIHYLNSELNGNTNDNSLRIYFSQSLSPGANYVPVSQVTPTFSGSNLPNSIITNSNQELPPSATYFTVANQDPPFSGVINFPNTNFPDFNTLIASLNSSGIGSGGLLVNISSVIDTIYLNDPIVINIPNNGPNQNDPLVISGDPMNPPIIRAYRGGTLDRDAIVYVLGNDYITMQNISLYDPPVNDDNFERMEWGIAILKRNSSNACQSVQLRNWNIRLQIEDTVSTGIYIGNHAFDPTQNFSVTSSSGCHSSLIFQRNTISKVNKGILLRGYLDPNAVFFDNNILIGDSVNTSNGNNIQALGGVNYNAYGIRILHGSNVFVHNNTIRNLAGNGLPALGEIRGISFEGASRGYSSVSKNRMSLSQGTTPGSIMGIYYGFSNAGIARIQNNRMFQFSNAPGTADVYGIKVTGNINNRLLLNSNSFTSSASLLSSGNVYGIFNETSARVYIQNDTISGITTASQQDVMAIYNQSSADSVQVTGNLIQNISKTGTAGRFFGYYNESPVMMAQLTSSSAGTQAMLMAPAGTENISFNTIKGIGVLGNTNLTAIRTSSRAGMNKVTNVNVMRSLTAATGTIEGIAVNSGLTITSTGNALTTVNSQGAIYGFTANLGGTVNMSNDSVYQVTQNGNGDVYCIFNQSSGNGTANKTVSLNTISTIVKSGSGTGAIYGIYHNTSGTGAQVFTAQQNIVQSIQSSGNDGIYGIYHNTSGTGVHTVSELQNSIIGVHGTGSSGAVYSIYHNTSGTGQNHTGLTNNNLINDVTNAGSGNAAAIFLGASSSGSKNAAKQNTISNISNSGSGNVYGIYHNTSGTGQGHVGNAINNTIFTISNTGSGKAAGISQEASSNASTDTAQANNISHITAGNGEVYGIYHNTSGTGQGHNGQAIGNTINNLSNTGAGGVFGVCHMASGTGATYGSGSNTISSINNSGTGDVFGIYHNTSGTGQGHTGQSSSNIISNLSNTGAGNAFGLCQVASGQSGTHSSVSNQIHDVSASGNGAVYGIYHNTSGTGQGHSGQANSNTIYNLSNLGSGNVYGVCTDNNNGGGTYTTTSNEISNIISSVSGNTFGIYHNTSGTSSSTTLIRAYANNIHDISNGTSAGSVTGMFLKNTASGAGSQKLRLLMNSVKNIQAASDSTNGLLVSGFDSVYVNGNLLAKIKTVSGIVNGIDLGAASSGGLITNNLIGDFTTVSSNSAHAINAVSTSGTSAAAIRFYYNTVHIAASSSAAGFGSNVFTTDGIAPLVMKNNVFINRSNSASGGGVRVLRSTNSLASSYFSSWDNNDYFVSDSSAAANFIYSDGTNNTAGIFAYKTFTAAENNSFSEPVAFLSTDGNNANFLKPDLSIATRIESGGSVSNLGVSFDYTGNNRYGSTGYTGSGTSTDVGAFENDYISAYHQWLGVVSNDWANAANWTANTLPSSGMDVVIPSGTPFSPSLVSGSATCTAMQLKAISGNSPTITIPASHILTLLGNLSGNGTFTGAGTLMLAAPAGQNIAGSIILGNAKINNITPAASTTIAAGSDVRVNDILTLQSGHLVTNNSLTLKSTAAKTAMISGTGTGSISGNVFVERYVSGVSGYHYLGSPVNNALQAQWSDDFYIYGDDNYSYNPDNFTNQYGSCWSYDETMAQADPMFGWKSHVNPTYPLTNGKGLVALVHTATVIKVNGPVNHGNYTSSFPVSRTNSTNAAADGFNLISNPYPSPISWNSFRSLPGQADFNATYFSWIPNGQFTGNYGYFNGVVGTMGVSDQIALGQGFFVTKTSSGSMPFIANNSIRVNSTSPQFFSQQTNGLVKLGFGLGLVEDECVIYQDAAAADTFDLAFDALKMSYPLLSTSQLYSLDASGKEYAIQVIPTIETDSRVIPLQVVADHGGKFQFSVQELIPDDKHDVYFEDRLSGNISLLQKGDTKEVQLNSGLSSGRFFLHFSVAGNPSSAPALTEMQMYTSGKNLFVNLPENQGNARIRIINPIGQLVKEFTFDGAKGLHTFNQSELGGAYVVQFVSDVTNTGKKLMIR